MIRANTRGLMVLVLAFFVLLGTGTAAAAVVVGPAYPAPGGNGFSSSGLVGDAGGASLTYSGFDAGAFSELYWGPQWGLGPGPEASLDGVLHSLSFLSVSGTTAIWEGTTSYTNPGGGGPASCASCPIRLELDVSGLGANPWLLEGAVSGLTTLAAGIGAVIDNSSGLDFVVNAQALADLGSGFVAINTVPQPASGGPFALSTFSGAFYSVPEPSLAMLFGLGLVGIAARRSRAC